MKRNISRKLFVFILIFLWLFIGWPVIWPLGKLWVNTIRIPPKIKEAKALTLTTNYTFTGNSTGWTNTNDGNGGSESCSTPTTTTRTAFSTFAYDGTIGNPAGAFKVISGTGNGSRYKGYIKQSITLAGSGAVNVSGKFDYYGTSTSWRTSGAFIRLDLYDSTNVTLLANLGCINFGANVTNWPTITSSSDYSGTGGTTYVVRLTFYYRNNGTTTATLAVDNVRVIAAPTGLVASSVADSSNAQLNWTTSTGTSTLSTYKVYRKTSTGVALADYLADAASNAYTDSTTTGNTTYYYAVTDVDTGSVVSPLSAESSILTRPGAPATPTFTNVKDITLTVNWSAPTGGASSYKIERCSGSGCSNFAEIRTGETGIFYNDSGLTGDTLYRYRVRATNATGDGGYSAIGETTSGLVSITITSDGTISYGSLAVGTSKDTTASGLNDTQTAQNNGNLAENFNIKTSNAIGGTQWTIGSSAGTNIFVHEFSTNGGGNWTQFADAVNYQTLATGVGVGTTAPFDLRITVPTDSDTLQKTITMTVQAIAQ